MEKDSLPADLDALIDVSASSYGSWQKPSGFKVAWRVTNVLAL